MWLAVAANPLSINNSYFPAYIDVCMGILADMADSQADLSEVFL